MKFISKTVLLLFLFVFFLTPPQAYALSNFNTDYQITYTIESSGMTHAQIHGTLTNTSSTFFASSYKMQIGFDQISNISVSDGKNLLSPKITKNADGYLIDITFLDRAIGKGNKQDFMLDFDTPKLARHYGKIWVIDIPGIANPAEFSNFTITLKVPPSFGNPSYSKPAQNTNTLIFTKEMLGKAGISLAFGESNVYSYHLTYHLRNPNLYPTSTQIALPPSTNYQEVSITSMDPKPTNVKEDNDGNWIAEYALHSAQKLDVNVYGTTEVHLKPKEVQLSDAERKVYTQPAKYWESDSDKIRELADDLRTPERIYAFVTSTLQYDFKRVTDNKPRLGALGALKNPTSAVCREYTDLFIALARAAGIPAREIDGYAYTENMKQRPLAKEKDILHVWPEYYDSEKKTWVMVDPTWGSTTGGVDYFNVFDFAHFAFVVKGLSSETPLPAGAYKFTDDAISKDVQVTFSQSEVSLKKKFTIGTTIPKVSLAGFPIEGAIRITNTADTYLPPEIVYVSSKNLHPGTQSLAATGIPPFGYADVPITFDPSSFLTNAKGDYTILVAGMRKEETVSLAPFYMHPAGGIIAIGLLTLIILTIAYRSRRLRLSR